MANIKISIISALNAAGIQATKEQVSKMSKSVDNSMKSVAKSGSIHWADFKAAGDMAIAGIKKAWGALTAGLKSAFKFETQTTQFKTLIGSIDDARAHMQMLKELGDTPPFGLDEFAKASRSLMVMSDGVLGYKSSLELCGDAAAATGNSLDAVSHAVGMAYANIRDGEPIGRAATQLKHMGLLTPEVIRQLEDMQKAGASGAETWAKLEDSLYKYKGAMAETESTGQGLMGAISSRWDNIVRSFGQAFSNDAKGGMSLLLDEAKKLEESGLVERWAMHSKNAISQLVDIAKVAFGWLSKLGDWYTSTRDFLEVAGAELGGFFGALSGGASIKEARTIGARQGLSVDKEQADRKADTEKQIADAIEKAKQAKIEADRKAAEQEANEKKKIQEQLAAADKKRAAKAAEERAKKEKEEHGKRMAMLEKERIAREKEAAKELRAQVVATATAAASENEDMARGEAQHRIESSNARIAELERQINQVNQIQNRAQSGMAADQRFHQGVSGNGYQYSTDANGINDFNQFQRANRYADKAQRIDSKNTPNADARNEARYQDLLAREERAKNGKGVKLSDRDQKWLDDYKDFDKYRKGTADLEKQIEAEETKKAQAEQQLRDDVKMIRENLKKALEVS